MPTEEEERSYIFEVSARDLKKMDWFGKSDPYFVFEIPKVVVAKKHSKLKHFATEVVGKTVESVVEEVVKDTGGLAAIPLIPIIGICYALSTHDTTPGYKQIYESPVIRKTLNCDWPKFAIREATLCEGNLDQEILVHCYDWDRAKSSDYIGGFSTTVRNLVNTEEATIFPLYKDGKTGRGSLIFKCTPSFPNDTNSSDKGISSAKQTDKPTLLLSKTHSHKLVHMKSMAVYSNPEWLCDQCRKRGVAMYHCVICGNYDECYHCATGGSDEVYKCSLHDHIVEEHTYTSDITWECSACKKPAVEEEKMYHCFTCGTYDLCVACLVKSQQNSQVK